MKNKISILFVLTMVMVITSLLGVTLVFAGSTDGHFNDNNAVDDYEIRWGGSTKYSTQWSYGISTWNALGEINIAPDTFWTYQDLTVRDVYSADADWAGLYDYDWIGSDELYLNKHYLDDDLSILPWAWQDATIKNVILHELGHALGLDHSHSGNIMHDTVNLKTSLGPIDKYDYNNNTLWD